MIPYPSHGRRLLDGLAAVLLGGLGAAGLLGSMGSIEARAQGPDESAETGVAAVDPAWLSLIESERRLDALAGLDGLAAGGLSLHALLEDAAVSGFAPAGLPVSVAFQRGQSANSIVNLTPQFTEFGWLFTGSFTEVRFSTPGGFLPGDLLTVTQGAQSLTLTVQALTARTHTLTDTVTGSAVPNAALTAFLYPALEPGQVFTATAVAGSGGAYQAPIAEGISAGDRGLVRQALDADRSLSTRLIAPQIMVQVGGESVSGITGPNSRVTIRAFSGGTPKFETSIVTSGQDGFFGHCFGTCDGHLGDPRLLPGDLVEIDTLGQIITTTVPQLTATPDRMAGEVTGISNPATQVSVRRWPGPVRPYGAAWSISFDTTNAGDRSGRLGLHGARADGFARSST